jgi:hypothetical protein
MDNTLQRVESFDRCLRQRFARKRCSFIPEPARQTKKRGRAAFSYKNVT